MQHLYSGLIVLNLPPLNGSEILQDWPGLSLILPEGGGLIIQRLYRGCMVLNLEARCSRTGLEGQRLIIQRLCRGCIVLNLPPVNGAETVHDGTDCLSSSPKSGGLIIQRLYHGCLVLNLPPVNEGETLQDWPGLSVLLPKSGGLVVQRLYCGRMVLNHLLSMEARRSRTGPDCLSSSPRAEAWSCSASDLAFVV
jgi:hypothetical protein